MSRSANGMSLIEVMIAISVLGVAMMGAFSALMTSLKYNQLMREEAAAVQAATQKMAEIRGAAATDFEGIFKSKDNGGYGTDVNGDPYTWTLRLLVGQKAGSMGIEAGGAVQPEGEVVLILDENPDEGDYGRDLDGDGGPDGVDLNGNGVIGTVGTGTLFPLDLNLDGDTSDDLSGAPGNMRMVPVVVVVRWMSRTGTEDRIDLMTVIGQ